MMVYVCVREVTYDCTGFDTYKSVEILRVVSSREAAQKWVDEMRDKTPQIWRFTRSDMTKEEWVKGEMYNVQFYANEQHKAETFMTFYVEERELEG